MKILQFDSIGGASGDMILAALFALGVDPEWVGEQLASLPVEEIAIEAEEVEEHRLRGVRVHVRLSGGQGGHEHRSLKNVRDIIEESKLAAPVKARALKVFTRLAEAEGAVHGKPPDQVTFHETGALDSIADILGSCLALDSLGVDGVSVGPLPVGTGTVQCQHGIYPLPAPATVELLKGHQVISTDEPHELLTPTGAALLTAWKTMDSFPPGSRVLKAGYAFGHRELDRRPNLLRACLLETLANDSDVEICVVLESNIDDTVPELLGALVERLLKEGALDVFTTPVHMKKQRPGTKLTVLCEPETRNRMMDLVFRESTTFGVREYTVRKTKLERRFEKVATDYGTVRIKIGTWQGDDVTRAPEMDDCIRLAAETGAPVRKVYECAQKGTASGLMGS